MGKREKAPQGVIGVPQFAELSACVLKQLPRDINPSIAQEWIKDSRGLSKVLRDALCPPPSVLEHVRASGYLDTSFDGREVHPLVIRVLTKGQALAEYRDSGGETWVWDRMERNIPYVIPKEASLNVMILDFGRDIESDEALYGMDELGVRPLVYEELIQYGIMYPEHQKRKHLIGLGTKDFIVFTMHAPVLSFLPGKRRSLGGHKWSNYRGPVWTKACRFLVVPK